MELAKLYTVVCRCVCVYVYVEWFISIYVVHLVAVARKLELVPSIFTSNESCLTKEKKKRRVQIVHRFFFVLFLLFTAVSNCQLGTQTYLVIGGSYQCVLLYVVFVLFYFLQADETNFGFYFNGLTVFINGISVIGLSFFFRFLLLCSQVVLSLSAQLSLQVSLTEKRRKKGNEKEIEKLFVYFMAKNSLRFDALTMHS